MTHEPGRERHMIHKCEKCDRTAREDELTLIDEDEYWCEGCISQGFPPRCAEYEDYSDPPSKLCPGCKAYKEHQI